MIERENVIAELKDAICYLKAHPDVRKRMSDSARIRSRQYDESAYYQNFRRLIFQIAAENAGQSGA